MKNARIIKSVLISAMISVFMLTAMTGVTSAAPPLSPKQRVEREFRQLELALARCIYEEVIPSPDLDYMSRAIFEFMRENPGVQRVVRANAGGYTVNDVSAEAPVSAPPRNIGGQRWFQHVTESGQPYYSMDSNSDGGSVVLFYAWPLNTGVDNSGPRGAFAAMIDFTAQVALIDDVEPFQLAFRGRPFFQHDWDDVDYDETTLDIRGARDITIRTMKPLPTRLDPRAPSTSTSRQSGRIGGGREANVGAQFFGGDEDSVSDADDGAKPQKKAGTASGGIMNIAVFALLLLIAVMLAYSIFKERARKATRVFREAPALPQPPKPAEDKVLIRSMTDAAPPVNAAGKDDKNGNDGDDYDSDGEVDFVDDVEDDIADKDNVDKGVSKVKDKPTEKRTSQIVDDYDSKPTIKMVSVSNDNVEQLKIEFSERERQAMSKMLKLIREDFVIMEEKLDRLSKRIDDLERRR